MSVWKRNQTNFEIELVLADVAVMIKHAILYQTNHETLIPHSLYKMMQHDNLKQTTKTHTYD